MKTKTKTSPTTTPKGFVPPPAKGEDGPFDFSHAKRVRFPKLEAKAITITSAFDRAKTPPPIQQDSDPFSRLIDKGKHEPVAIIVCGPRRTGKSILAQSLTQRVPDWAWGRYAACPSTMHGLAALRQQPGRMGIIIDDAESIDVPHIEKRLRQAGWKRIFILRPSCP